MFKGTACGALLLLEPPKSEVQCCLADYLPLHPISLAHDFSYACLRFVCRHKKNGVASCRTSSRACGSHGVNAIGTIVTLPHGFNDPVTRGNTFS